jgi:hypothetical protein
VYNYQNKGSNYSNPKKKCGLHIVPPIPFMTSQTARLQYFSVAKSLRLIGAVPHLKYMVSHLSIRSLCLVSQWLIVILQKLQKVFTSQLVNVCHCTKLVSTYLPILSVCLDWYWIWRNHGVGVNFNKSDTFDGSKKSRCHHLPIQTCTTY